jgi:hypothetical protein
MASPSPAPLFARPVADDAAEPPGQAGQVTLADPRALIRPVDPDGRPAHDPCVIACLLQPALFHARHLNVQIDTKGEHTPGMTVADGWRVTKRAPNAMVMGEWTGRGSAGC